MSSGKQIDDLLDRGVCFLVSDLQFGGGGVELGGLALKQAVGQGATDTLVEEDEHQCTLMDSA
jgi:hypothetical protein